MFTKFNTNRYIYVEMSAEGWRLLKQYFDRLHIDGNERVADYKENNTKLYLIDGKPKHLTEFQLHEAIRLFGEMSPCAGGSPFKDCEVYLDGADLTPVKSERKD